MSSSPLLIVAKSDYEITGWKMSHPAQYWSNAEVFGHYDYCLLYDNSEYFFNNLVFMKLVHSFVFDVWLPVAKVNPFVTYFDLDWTEGAKTWYPLFREDL